MVKKRFIIAAFLLLYIFAFSTGVRVIILKDKSINIPVSFENKVKDKLTEVAKSLNLNANERPARYGLIFDITSLKADSEKYKKVVFVRDDKAGNYVYFAGSYYRAYHTLYKYDYKKKRFVQSKYGNYVRLSNYIWARDEDEKYVVFAGFYKKTIKYVSDKKFWLYASITFIDFKSSFILFQKSVVFTGKSYDEILKNMNLSIKKEKFYSEKPTIAFYEKTLSPLGSFVKKYFYQEERYTMYDRSYLNYLFKEMRYQDLISGGEEVGTYLKPAHYLVVVKILNSGYKLIESTEYLEFSNPVNGGYVGKTPVYAGTYYRFDLKTGEYIPDRKKGSYVKVKKGAWAVEDEYISAGSFNDLFIENVAFHSYFIDALVMVVDGKNGNLKVAKKFTVYLKSPKMIREDRFGSVKGNYKEDVIKEAYEKLGKEISDYVRQFFAIETQVSDVEKDIVTISAGKNYGVKSGYYFRVIDEGYTQGYIKVTNVKEKSAVSRVVRYLQKQSKIKAGNLALEDFDYRPFLGIDLSFMVSSDEIYMEMGYAGRDLYAKKKYSAGILLGVSADKYKLGAYGMWYAFFNKSIGISPKISMAITTPYEDSEDEDEYSQYSLESKLGLELNYPFYETIFKPNAAGIIGFVYLGYPKLFGVDVGLFYNF